MEDKIIRATGADDQVRVFVAHTTETVEKARKIHGLYPTSADALGRVLTASALIGTTLKNRKDTVTLRVMGDGPLGSIVAVGNNRGEVKGFIQNPHVYMPVSRYGRHAFSTAVGMGALHVSKDMGLKDPYTGSVPLASGEIAGDISEYYTSSEQIPTACGLGVTVGKDSSVQSAGGFLIQILPGTDDDIAAKLEKNLEIMKQVSGLYLQGYSPQDVLADIMKDFTYQVHSSGEIKYFCDCSREKLTAILESLGADELRDIINTQEEATVNCHFCNETYQFTKENLEEMIKHIEHREAH